MQLPPWKRAGPQVNRCIEWRASMGSSLHLRKLREAIIWSLQVFRILDDSKPKIDTFLVFFWAVHP